MKIEAAILGQCGGHHRPYASGAPLDVRQVDLAAPQRGEILVRIDAAGICHSDLSVINGDRPRPLPMALGHEAAGVVEALGPGVDELKIGDQLITARRQVTLEDVEHFAEFTGDTEVEADGLSMANVQITVGFRREARFDGRMLTRGQVVPHDLPDEVLLQRRGFGGCGCGVRISHVALTNG